MLEWTEYWSSYIIFIGICIHSFEMSHEQIFVNQKNILLNVMKVIITGSGFIGCDDFFSLILLLLSHNLTEAFVTVDLWVPVHHLLRSTWTQPISRKLYSIFLSVF